MPPIVASAPGSIGNIKPVLRKDLASWSRVTPASTLTSRSSALTFRTRFISRRSTQIPAAQGVHVSLERGAGPEGNRAGAESAD